MSEGITRALRYVNLSSGSEESETRSTDETASELLKRRFSTTSAVSTSSSFANRMQKVATEAHLEAIDDFRIIGLGSCGTIFEIPGTELVLKKGANSASLIQDFRLTNRVHQAIEEMRLLLQEEFPEATIPRSPSCPEFHAADDKTFWSDSVKKRFPTNRRSQEPILVETRILPLPVVVREALIELYFDEDKEVQQEAKDDQNNKDCLVRIYLGERESLQQQDHAYDSLRNFELRLNLMEDLSLDIEGIASEVAIGLAIIHWQAQIDGMDTEFVLGSSATWDEVPGDSKEKGEIKIINFRKREIHLWMLDFDKASEINLTQEDIDKKLVPAFLGNDPYFPLPNDDDEDDHRLWIAFSAAYLKASNAILTARTKTESMGKASEKVNALPKRFLEKVEEQVRKNAEWDTEDHVVFA